VAESGQYGRLGVVMRTRSVRKVSAQQPFTVLHRPTGWKVRVHSVKHTLRAFVKWLLWKFRQWLGRCPMKASGPMATGRSPLFQPGWSLLAGVMTLSGVLSLLCVSLWVVGGRALDHLLWRIWWLRFELRYGLLGMMG
jgi:hypothetical protein